jgi:hypothetical protein
MKNKEHKSSYCFSYESNAEEAHFMRKLKKGSRKYEGNIPFKFFNCGKVGHFSNEFPYAKDEINDDKEDGNVKKGRKHHQHKRNHKQDKHENKKKSYKQKKNLYSKWVSDSYEERSESSFNSDREETPFMVIKTNIYEEKGKEMMDSKEEKNVETYGEVDLEEKLMCSLRKIKNLRKNNLKQQEATKI